MARRLGVSPDTIRNWDVGRAQPALWQWPGIVRFLGYAPFSTDGSLVDRLRAYRRLHGLSQKRLAALLGVDPSTMWHWERGYSQPNEDNATRIARAISQSL